MPAEDRYHQTVAIALKKQGWKITRQQAAVVLEERRLWIDLEATKEDQQLRILVEVKGFENMPSPVEYLASALGKYMLYRLALELSGDPAPLYMAVPSAAYNEGILSEELGRYVIKKVRMRLMIFDPESEEIVKWIPSVRRLSKS